MYVYVCENVIDSNNKIQCDDNDDEKSEDFFFFLLCDGFYLLFAEKMFLDKKSKEKYDGKYMIFFCVFEKITMWDSFCFDEFA